MLQVAVSEQKIKNSIFSTHVDLSPGSDGWISKFFRRHSENLMGNTLSISLVAAEEIAIVIFTQRIKSISCLSIAACPWTIFLKAAILQLQRVLPVAGLKNYCSSSSVSSELNLLSIEDFNHMKVNFGKKDGIFYKSMLNNKVYHLSCWSKGESSESSATFSHSFDNQITRHYSPEDLENNNNQRKETNVQVAVRYNPEDDNTELQRSNAKLDLSRINSMERKPLKRRCEDKKDLKPP